MVRIMELIESRGLELVGRPYVRHLGGKIWEMRAQGWDRMAHNHYVAVTGKIVLILRTFVKYTQKTPRAEIELAVRPLQEVE